ncbi:PAS domain S-box protein [Reinekea forsetii]|nr:PAS domain S-box protein [Reinekea forsetii]
MPETHLQSLYLGAFTNSDSLAILCSKEGTIQAISQTLAEFLRVESSAIIGQQLLVSQTSEAPNLEWLTEATQHQKQWLITGRISVLGNFSGFEKVSSFFVKKLTVDNEIVGYQLKLEKANALQTTLPQNAWLQLFDDSPDGIALFDESLKIISTNSAFKKLTGLHDTAIATVAIDDVVTIAGSFSDWLSSAETLAVQGTLKGNLGVQTSISIRVTPFDIGNHMYFWCFIADLSHATKLQQKLNATLSHFKTLFENNRDGIALTNVQGNYIEANQQFATMLGFDRDYIIGRHFAYFNAKHSFELTAKEMQQFVDSGFIEPFEKQLQRADGSITNVSVQLFPHYDDEDTYSGAWCIYHPISAEEEKYRRQKKRFEMLLEKSIDAIAYSSFEGIIEVANQAFCDMVQRTSAELVGMSYKEITPAHDIQREESIFRDQLLARGYSDVYSKDFELPDGRLVPVSIRTVLIRSESGHPEGVWSISRSNEQRDRLVDSLAESERRFRSLFSNSFDAIALWSPKDEIQYANRAYLELIGYSQEELRDLDYRKFTPAGWEEVDALMAKQVAERGYSDIVEKEVLSKNGRRIPISIRASGMKDSAGNIIGSWVIIRDISDYRNTFKELEHSQNLLRQTSRMSRVGGWELNIEKQEFTFTEETYRILSIPSSYSLTVKSISKVLDPHSESMIVQKVKEAFISDTHQEVELKLSGFEPERWIRVSAQTGYETGNNKKYLYGAVQDITDFKQKEKTLEFDKNIYQQLAFHDPLTKLPNRLLLSDRFEQTTSQAMRDKKVVALIVIDLDNFKQINDEYGHPAGDALLKELAQRFVSNVRKNDTVSRLGGDEFIIIARLDNPNDIDAFAQKILLGLSEPVKWQDHSFNSSASMGVALYPKHGEDFDTLYNRADKALYWRKHHEKNGYTLADQSESS